MFGPVIIEFALFFAVLILFYQCCLKARDRERQTDEEDSSPGGPHSYDPEDLRRFRERFSERRRGEDGAPLPDERDARSVAARQALVELNLFSRKIRREESVRELARLLAVARGGAADEELGEAEGAAIKPDFTCALSEAIDTIDAATATPQPQAMDPIPTAPPEPPSCTADGSSNPARALEPIRTLWSSLAHNLPGSERSTDGNAAPSTLCSTSPSAAAGRLLQTGKLECSVCLDPYAPGAVVAWAKDGGDPPDAGAPLTASAHGRETGCDHIFHAECLVAWLQDHDDCPLCRRRVVHADAEARFAGWGTG